MFCRLELMKLSASLETICRMGIGFISAWLYPHQNTRLSTSYKVRVSLQIRFLVYGGLRHFQQYFSYIVAVSFIDGGN